MPHKKTLKSHLTHSKVVRGRRGISPIISTIIISGTLLIILVIASFVSANILELQLASTEFEQAKTNMMLLDEVIQDVALRRGSGGYVQFNQRTGGINILENTETIKVTGPVVPIKNMNFTGNKNGWTTSTPTGTGNATYGYDSTRGNPSPGSGIGSYYHKATSKQGTANIANILFTTETSFTYAGGVPLFAYLSYSYTLFGNSIGSGGSLIIRLVKPDSTTADLDTRTLPTSQVAWTPRIGLVVNPTNFAQPGIYKLQVVNRLVAGASGTNNYVQLNFDDIGLELVGGSIYDSPPLINLVYRAGSKTSGTDLTMRGTNTPNVNLTDPLAYLRIETGNGIQIKLDYFRVRIVNTATLIIGGNPTNFIEITFIRLVRGNNTNTGGSGTVNLKVQNIAVNPNSQACLGTQGIDGKYHITIKVNVGLSTTPLLDFKSDGRNFVVTFTLIVVQVSTA
jgi:hypothetical protein